MLKRLLPLVLGFVFAACGDNKPCTDCPAIEGRYSVAWQVDTGTCIQFFDAPPEPLILIGRSGSTISSTLFGIGLTGTLYDTFELTLVGTQFEGGIERPESISVFGRYVPSMSADAGTGATISGDYRAQHHWQGADGDTRCETRRRFSAQRLP